MEYSNTVAALLALLVMGWTIISVRARDSDTSPAILHNVVWALALLIVGSGLLRYEPLSGYAWLLIASAILCFNIGIAVAGVQPRYRPPSSVPAPAPASLVTRRMYRILLVCFSVGFAFYLATIATKFGLSTLVSDPTRIRSDLTYLEAFPLYGKILFYLGPVCLILTMFPEYVQGLRKSPTAWRLAIIAYLAGAQLATLQRANLFVAIVWAAGLLVLRRGRAQAAGRSTNMTAKRVAALVVAAVVGFGVFQGIALALGKTGSTNSAISSVVDPRIQDSPALGLLYYASSGIAAFGRLTESPNQEWPPPASEGPAFGDYNPQTWGAATFATPLKLVPGVRHWNELSAFINVPMPTNVYTWLEPWYRDFRWAGVLLGSFVSGIVIGRFARRGHVTPEARLMAGLLVGYGGLATFDNSYLSVTSVVIYATLWLLGALRRARESAEDLGVRPATGALDIKDVIAASTAD